MRPLAAILGLVAFASLAVPAAASGSPETKPAEEPTDLTILLVARAGSESSGGAGYPDLSSRLLLEISPYLWSRFSSDGETIESTSDSTYRESGRRQTSRERMGEYEILRVELRVVMSRPSAPASETVKLSFSIDELLGADGEVTMQPGRYALVRAVKQSARRGGDARVLSVERQGPRGFTAEVSFR